MMARAEADLREAEAASVAAQARADAAQVDAAAAARRAAEMRAVWEWLRTQTAQPPAPAESPKQASKPQAMRFGRPVPETAITDLAHQSLENLGGQATTREIRDRLAREGHNFEQGQIRAAMRYLSKKNNPVVETTPGSGLWRLQGGQQAAPFRPAVTGFPAANGAGGRP